MNRVESLKREYNMTKKRLDRDSKWGFQGFHHYDMRVEFERIVEDL